MHSFDIGTRLPFEYDLKDFLLDCLLHAQLSSVLSIMQMPEAGRQIIYGVVIIAMLLVYGRNQRVTS